MDDIEQKSRIFLIDDHPVMRQGLAQLLAQESYVICGEAENRRQTLERIESSDADLAILDISLGGENGVKLIADLRRRHIRVLVYSMHEDIDTIEKAIAAGADGYVGKRERETILLHAVSDLLAGGRHIGPLASQSLAKRALFASKATTQDLLSKRERTILTMLARGKSNPQIAVFLRISSRTVETYIYRIIAKLKVSGIRELREYISYNAPK